MNKHLKNYAFTHFKRRPKPSVTEWASSSVELSERITEHAGPYSTRLHPYVKEVLECIRDGSVKKVSLCWGSQTSKTTSLYVMLGYVICQKPQPILWVFPNLNLCRTFSADRWMPFCRDSAVIREEMPKAQDGSVDEEKFTLYKQEFNKCTMNLVGAGSSANVRSYPISILALDEIDVIPEMTRRECLERIKGKHDYKILQSSTPVGEEGGIWQEFMEGDRRKYHVPCPHCGDMFNFRWENDEGELNLKWDKDAKFDDGTFDVGMVESSAYYMCEHCEGEIKDLHKPRMLKYGEWRAGSTNVERGVRSYHLNSFYSPMISFGRMAVEFVKSAHSVDGLRNFVNGWLAEPWRANTRGLVNPDALKVLDGGYERGEKKGDYRLIAVDVQRDHFVYLVRGFDRDGASYLIDNGIVPSFEDVHRIFTDYECSYGVVDTGYRTQEIYEEIHLRRPKWFGAKGWDKMPTSYRTSSIDPYSNDQRAGKSAIHLLHINKDTWGQELLKRRAGEMMNWKVYSGLDTEYIRQLLSTNLVENVDKRGRSKLEWVVDGHKQDHFWDCEQYVLALSHVFGLGGAAITRSEPVMPKPRKPRKRKNKGGSFWGNS